MTCMALILVVTTSGKELVNKAEVYTIIPATTLIFMPKFLCLGT